MSIDDCTAARRRQPSKRGRDDMLERSTARAKATRSAELAQG
ncbi:hypothetical protein GVAMD_0827 [Gardnerella vaginalis AMD]|nr:hypothetical protein GVAMD_0827 [Gardnerella vaginalis AMD]